MARLYGVFASLHGSLALDRVREAKGQTFTEYAVIVATIAVGVVAAVGVLRDAVISALSNAAGAI